MKDHINSNISGDSMDHIIDVIKDKIKNNIKDKIGIKWKINIYLGGLKGLNQGQHHDRFRR